MYKSLVLALNLPCPVTGKKKEKSDSWKKTCFKLMSLPFSTTHLVPVALKKKLYIFLMETGNVYFF